MTEYSLSQETLAALRATALPAVQVALLAVVEQAALPPGTEPLTAAQKQEFVDSYTNSYYYQLGEYILTQNPYAAVANIGTPKLPTSSTGALDPDAEIPLGGIWDRPNLPYAWPDVLKAGVLKTRHSALPLDANAPVPFGTMLPFGIITGNNDLYMDQHNIVKMLAIRYTLKNRPKPNPDTTTPNPDPATGQPPTVPSNAYLVVCYSGGDT